MNQTKHSQTMVATFAILMAFLAWMAVKLPMPALPFLAHYFHTSNQVFKVSVTLNLVAFAVSQIVWGPLSERYGRKAILIAAYIVAIIGTLLALTAFNVEMYITGRILEGFAVGSAAPIGRAIMADSMDKIQMTKTYTWYAIAGLLPPAIGPVIGGYLLVYIGWRSIFAFFLILAIAYLIALCLYFKNTNTPDSQHHIVHDTIRSIKHITRQSDFWRYALCYAILNGFMITYYAAMPYWYVVHFHMSESSYAWLAFLPIASYLIGSMITRQLIKRVDMDQILKTSLSCGVVIAAVVLISALFMTPTIVNLNIVIMLMSILSGLITPIINATLMDEFRAQVTSLTAVMSGLRICGAGLLVLVTANINLTTFWPLGIYLAVLTLLPLIIYRYLARGCQT